MAKFELLSDGMNYKGSFYSKGAIIDFDDDVNVKGLEEDGHIGPEGAGEKRAEELEKAEQERAELAAEAAAKQREANLKVHEASQPGPAPKRAYNRKQ
jgi:hypothetical protein